MSDAEARNDWIRRALGFDVKAGAAASSGAGNGIAARGNLLPIWMDAKEEVDAGINRLQQALREFDDEDLNQIAEFGLFGATEGEMVRLIVSLQEADSGTEGALPKVRNAVADYRDFLDGAPIVDLIEENPFGVAVPLRKVLGAALDQIERLAS